jgi:hypothetical protein
MEVRLIKTGGGDGTAFSTKRYLEFTITDFGEFRFRKDIILKESLNMIGQ